ncbi:type 2 lantipeptide synthetase LanM [Clostridium sporogenes]|nr:type 2 lantipeptide synthetase LanM [Clostridium sporogenes]NFS25681.1 type 2 lantipeptide synthetase LanM [Clostridium sporogenes]
MKEKNKKYIYENILDINELKEFSRKCNNENEMFEFIYITISEFIILKYYKNNKIILDKEDIFFIIREELVKKLYREIKDSTQSLLVYDINIRRKNNELIGENPEEEYHNYIKNFFNIYIYDVIKNYHIWYKRLEVIIYQNLLFISEFMNDLIENTKNIFNFFNVDNLKLVSIKFFGDIHNGKCVVCCTFNEIKLLYKPTLANIDILFNDVCQLTCEDLCLKNLHLKTHAWCLYIENAQCEKQDDIKLYYKNCGFLLSLIYALNGIDIHNENIIANGVNPIIVDYETIVAPILTSKNMFSENDFLDKSVFRTAMLPMKYNRKFEGINDCSSIGEKIEVETIEKKLINKFRADVYEKRDKIRKSDTEKYLPRYGNLAYGVSNYYPQLISGFELGYSEIQKNKVKIIEKITNARNKIIRVVLRSTIIYKQLLNRISAPDMLYDENHTRDFLRRILSKSIDSWITQEIIESEITQLLQGNIPYFYMNISENEIFDRNNKVGKVPVPVTDIISKINTMDSKEKNFQLNLIEIAFNIKGYNFITIHSDKSNIEKEIHYMREESKYYGKYISLQKNWQGHYRYDFMNLGIYEGEVGLTFLDYGDRQLDLDNKKVLDKLFIKIFNDGDFGYLNGLSSINFLLANTNWFNQRELNYYSRKITSLINKNKQDIPKELENNYDFIDGMSGLIITLYLLYLKKNKDLYKSTNKEIKKSILKIGMHLVCSIKNNEVKCSGGLAHGELGIIVALQIIQKEYEDNNCLDIVENIEKKQDINEIKTNHWCNGLTGYLVAEYILYRLDKKESRKDIINDIAYKILSNFTYDEDYSLCHGNMGVLDVLLVLERENLLDSMNLNIYKNIEEKYFQSLNNKEILKTDISLFTGISGIEYYMKRKSSKLESVLTLGF